jgi:hypothetical protein
LGADPDHGALAQCGFRDVRARRVFIGLGRSFRVEDFFAVAGCEPDPLDEPAASPSPARRVRDEGSSLKKI